VPLRQLKAPWTAMPPLWKAPFHGQTVLTRSGRANGGAVDADEHSRERCDVVDGAPDQLFARPRSPVIRRWSLWERPWREAKVPRAGMRNSPQSPRTSMPCRFLPQRNVFVPELLLSCLRSSISVAAAYQRMRRPCSSRIGLKANRKPAILPVFSPVPRFDLERAFAFELAGTSPATRSHPVDEAVCLKERSATAQE